MPDAGVVSSKREVSPRTLARYGGLFWLLTAVTGTLSMFTPGIIHGNAAATAANILGREPMYRLGVTANLVAAVCYLVATVFVYELLKPVDRRLSLLAAFFSVTASAVAVANLLFHFAPLIVLGGAEYLNVFTVEQLQAMALTLLRMRDPGFYLSHILYGLHCLLVGTLILRSTFINGVIGVLMTVAGLGWITMGLSNLVVPGFGRTLMPFIMMPGVVGELSLTFWLLIAGVNVQRWKEQAA